MFAAEQQLAKGTVRNAFYQLTNYEFSPRFQQFKNIIATYRENLSSDQKYNKIWREQPFTYNNQLKYQKYPSGQKDNLNWQKFSLFDF